MSGKLTDEMIAGASIPDGQTTRKLFDGHGLYLFLSKAGARQWRLKYGPNGGDRTKTFGEYPAVSIDAAREAVAAFRATLAAAKPSAAPAPSPAVAAPAPHTPGEVPTFGQVAAHWLTYKDGKAKNAGTLYKRRLYAGYLAALNPLPISAITPAQVRAELERIVTANGCSTAHRAATYAENIFDHAQRFDVFHNPAARRKGWLPAVEVTHHEGITDPDEFGLLMERVDLWQSPFGPTTANAVRFMMRTIARVQSIAGARWEQMKDLDKPELARWEIPAENMKGGKPFIVPLARQAVAILEAQRRANPLSPYCFPHRDRPHSPMSRDNPRRAFQFLGYAPKDNAPKDGPTVPTRQTAHGARTCFSTLVRELGKGQWDDRLIEMCQAHADRNRVRDAYNRAERLEERRELFQWWADEIERMKRDYTVAAA